MLYLKPLIKRTTSDPEIISELEQLNSDKEAMDFLINKGFDRDTIISQLEKHYGVEYVDLKKEKMDAEAIVGFDLEALKEKMVVPYLINKKNKVYFFASNDIMNISLRANIQMACKSKGFSAEFKFAFEHEIIDRYFRIESVQNKAPKGTTSDDFNAQEWVDNVIISGIEHGSSDIHIESIEYGIQVRYRVDGVLTEKKIFTYDMSIISTIMVRIKIISGMDISEKRRPQDGRLDNFRYKNSLYDFRVSSVNTIFGEKIVMRIFNKTSKTLSFEELGFSKEDTEKIKRMLRNKNGIIYMAGATGSGKTTSLYTMIDEINRDDINIYTIEDPVEKTIKNINQIQIDTLAGIEYANTLRALLRQDPDVIIVGEIRDVETADLSVRASLTGHLVLSTIHANNAIDSINRLRDMGIEPYLLGASSLGFLSQRLVRTLCPHCKKKIDKPSSSEESWLSIQERDHNAVISNYENVYEPVGCSHCNAGYKGRLAIVEIIEVTEALQDAIKDGDSSKIEEIALKEGFKPLIVNGLQAVEDGLTSIEEIMRQI